MRSLKFATLGLAALALAGCSETVGQKQGLGTLLGAVAGGRRRFPGRRRSGAGWSPPASARSSER